MGAGRRFFKKIRWFLLGGVISLAGVCLEAASRFEPAALAPPPGPLALDRHGEILRLVTDSQGRKAVSLPEGPLPPAVAAAFIAAEDQRFWQHPWVDVIAHTGFVRERPAKSF